MRFKLGHESYPQYDMYILSNTQEVEEQINRLGPFDIIASAYDWPNATYFYRGWTDKINSIWWPRGSDQFATCVLLIDDLRADLIEACVNAQYAATTTGVAPRPHLILQCLLSPAEQSRAAERYEPSGLLANQVTSETELIAWKFYPLPPVSLTTITAGDQFQGLWLLPLVDMRYFWRNTALHKLDGGSAGSDSSDDFPRMRIDYRQSPNWMPLLRAYPDDSAEPANYVAITNNGTHPGIEMNNRRGEVAETQAKMENWRVVCRDVRSNYNAPAGSTQHTDFTGVLCDYPDDPAMSITDSSYHVDAIRLGTFTGNKIAGGACDQTIVRQLVSRKINCLFKINNLDEYYSVVITADVSNPTSVSDLSQDDNGLGIGERNYIPKAYLGVPCKTKIPSSEHQVELLDAAKQWALLYFLWRAKQYYFKYPGIAPVIPNGYSASIRWDFSSFKFETAYIAVEGVEGTDDGFSAKRETTWGRIDGEGKIEDELDGYYAWTELEDIDGDFQVKDGGIVGYVKNFNADANDQPARSDNDKRAVPVGMRVRMWPGIPYLDAETGKIFDHWRFVTDDLLQVVRPTLLNEVNEYGHRGAIIRRWNPTTKQFEDSQRIWLILLEE